MQDLRKLVLDPVETGLIETLLAADEGMKVFSGLGSVKLSTNNLLGCGCSAVAELSSRDHEVEGSNPAGCWAVFFFSYLLSQYFLL